MKTPKKKLTVENETEPKKTKSNPIQKRVQNVHAIWNNIHQDDNGIEKIIRLFLSASQLLFPGIYIKHFASSIHPKYQDLAIDFYIIIKVMYPFLTLFYQFQHYNIVIYIIIYLLVETILYIPTLIFASDLFSQPRSYKRSMLLLFLNYLELIFSYAVLYSVGNYLNKPLAHWFDAIYFSIITSTSIGYGDYYPVTLTGKFLVSTQSLLFLFFVVLFLNFFSNKIKVKGYFDDENKD